MMKIAIIDADLIGRKKHRFPNLACEKISGYWKSKGAEVVLKTDYENLDQFNKVYVSKVFTDTLIDESVLQLPNVEYGGTGFFFDKAPNLPNEIEHSFPDYHLYDEWINEQIVLGKSRNEFKEYLDYSIGFLTRGCFRKCGFCVNQKYDRVFEHSPLEEFYDPLRKKICLLDDNFFGCPNWKQLLQTLIDTGKPFKFKQGLDERLLTDEKCEMLFNCKYDGDVYFAFDNIEDYDLIEKKMDMIAEHTDRQCIFYVLCGFDEEDKYDEEFWNTDIVNTFERIKLLINNGHVPYIMRFNKYKESPHKGMYVNLARWCNQPSFLKKKSLYEFCTMDCHKGMSTERYMNDWLQKHPETESYFHMKFMKRGEQ